MQWGSRENLHTSTESPAQGSWVALIPFTIITLQTNFSEALESLGEHQKEPRWWWQQEILSRKNPQPLLRASYPWAQQTEQKEQRPQSFTSITLSKLLLTIKLCCLGDYQVFVVELHQTQALKQCYVLFRIHLPVNKCSVIKVIRFYFD